MTINIFRKGHRMEYRICHENKTIYIYNIYITDAKDLIDHLTQLLLVKKALKF